MLGQTKQCILHWEHFKYFFHQTQSKSLKSVSKTMKQNSKCTSFKNKIHIEYRQNYLHYMYISFALGLIANAKERKSLVEYRLQTLHDVLSLPDLLFILAKTAIYSQLQLQYHLVVPPSCQINQLALSSGGWYTMPEVPSTIFYVVVFSRSASVCVSQILIYV